MATSISAFLPSLNSTDGAVLTLGSAWLLYLLLTRKEGIPHPPGPRALPLVGNMFQIPQKDEWPIYEAWAKKYGENSCETFQFNALITNLLGPITYLTMLGNAHDCAEFIESHSGFDGRKSGHLFKPTAYGHERTVKPNLISYFRGALTNEM